MSSNFLIIFFQKEEANWFWYRGSTLSSIKRFLTTTPPPIWNPGFHEPIYESYFILWNEPETEYILWNET
jgi:hypothetical protein